MQSMNRHGMACQSNDLCLHLNEVNVKLLGGNKTVIIMFDLIKAYEAKLEIFTLFAINTNIFQLQKN